MKVTEIVVSAGRTFNHPYEQYANLKPQVTVKATLEEGEDAAGAVKALQAQAEKLVEEHKQLLIGEIKRIRAMTEAEGRFYDLQRALTAAQNEMAALKNKFPEIAQLALPAERDDAQEQREEEYEQ